MSDAFEAGLRFFLGPNYDGHLEDRDPGETFDTKWGVTEMTYAAALWEGIVTKSFADVQTSDDVKPIYRVNYYDANRCGEMPGPVACVLFVDAVLMGVKTPARNLQAIVGVDVDGDIGDLTVAAVKRSTITPANMARQLDQLDLAHLQSLDRWAIDGRGWSNREAGLLAVALQLV